MRGDEAWRRDRTGQLVFRCSRSSPFLPNRQVKSSQLTHSVQPTNHVPQSISRIQPELQPQARSQRSGHNAALAKIGNAVWLVTMWRRSSQLASVAERRMMLEWGSRAGVGTKNCQDTRTGRLSLRIEVDEQRAPTTKGKARQGKARRLHHHHFFAVSRQSSK